MNKLPLALNDANRAIELKPGWSKAYRRKASVLGAMGKYGEAKEVCAKALEVGLAEVQPDGREKVGAEIKKLVEGEAGGDSSEEYHSLTDCHSNKHEYGSAE